MRRTFVIGLGLLLCSNAATAGWSSYGHSQNDSTNGNNSPNINTSASANGNAGGWSAYGHSQNEPSPTPSTTDVRCARAIADYLSTGYEDSWTLKHC